MNYFNRMPKLSLAALRLVPALALISIFGCGIYALGYAQGKDNAPTSKKEALIRFFEADDELNRVYKKCTSPDATTVQAISHLRSAQKSWILFRDENAAAYQTGISSRKVTKDENYIYAQEVVTRQRIQDLKILFHDALK